MFDFIKAYSEWIILLSILTFIGTLLIVPSLVIRIPTDYFCDTKRHKTEALHPLIRLVLVILKNILGGILVLAGFIMLFTPGQGLITLFIGLMIMNYPGKYVLERWLIVHSGGLSAINWYRARHHQPPLQIPEKN